jgi:hypothetical protein
VGRPVCALAGCDAILEEAAAATPVVSVGLRPPQWAQKAASPAIFIIFWRDTEVLKKYSTNNTQQHVNY